MPTTITEFSSNQDALTVFIDYRKDKKNNTVEKNLSDFFGDSAQFLYKDEKFPIEGNELFEFLNEVREEERATFTANNRFVFCHYLELNELNNDWIKHWQTSIADFQRRLRIAEVFLQYHVVCLKYDSAQKPIDENGKGKVASLLKKLCTEETKIAHVTYLLYTNGIGGYESQKQERGMCQLLYILSRENYEIVQPLRDRTRIKRISYSDYSEHRANQCQEIINEINEWCDRDRDRTNDFTKKVSESIRDFVKKMQEEENAFGSRAEIHPVRISDFQRGFWPWSKYEVNIDLNHPSIRLRKGEFFKNICESMLSEFQHDKLSEIITWVENTFSYRELCELKKRLSLEENNSESMEYKLKQDICNTCALDQNIISDEITNLIHRVFMLLKENLEEFLDNIEKVREEKIRKKQNVDRELVNAGRFHDLDECLQKISKETAFKPIVGKEPENSTNVCLLGSKCVEHVQGPKKEIVDIANAYSCDGLNLDITLLWIGDQVNFDEKDAEVYLADIF